MWMPLNLLSPLKENHPDAGASPLLRKEGSLLPPLILTPHEGEFMRLLGTDDKDVLKGRVVAAVREFSQKHQVILVLKGERVLIGEPGGKGCCKSDREFGPWKSRQWRYSNWDSGRICCTGRENES